MYHITCVILCYFENMGSFLAVKSQAEWKVKLGMFEYFELKQPVCSVATKW